MKTACFVWLFCLGGCAAAAPNADNSGDGPADAEAAEGGAAGADDVAPDGGAAGASEAGGMAGNANAAGAGEPDEDPCDLPAQRTVDVSSAKALTTALAAASPGTLIRLAAGNYSGPFLITRSGRSDDQAILCGPRTAVLQTSAGDDVLTVRASDWVLSGFTVTGGQRGVLLDGSSRSSLLGLRVFHIAQEAIHLRKGSVGNLVKGCEVTDTGFVKPEFGEGIYVGSAQSAWSKYGGGKTIPDKSDGNQIIDNVIGPNVRAEAIDIKEGTSGGAIIDNTFWGKGIAGQNYADSWVDLKGNGYTVQGNTGHDALLDGFQVHVILAGWGEGNVFDSNTAHVNGPGYGFWIEEGAKGNRIACDNEVDGAAKGMANVACVQSSGAL